MSYKFSKTGSLAFLSFMFLSQVGHSANYVNNDLTGSLNLGSYDNVTITNNRTIVDNANFPFLYLTGNYQNNVTITNNGSISHTDPYYEIIYATRMGNPVAGQLTMTVNNNGNLATTGNWARPISVLGGPLRDNNGTPDPSDDIYTPNPFDFVLNNASGATITSDSANPYYAAVNVTMDDDVGNITINNAGTVAVSDADAFNFSGSGRLEINNSGTISGAAGHNAIYSSVTNFDLNILEGSSISGAIVGGGTNNNLNIKKVISVAQLNTLTSQLSGTWNTNLASNSRLTINSGETLSISNLTIASGNEMKVNGTFTGTANISSGGKISGTGTVGTTNIASGGYLAAGNSIGTLNVSGALTLNSGSITEIEFDRSSMDKTIASGNITIAGNADFKLYNTPDGYFVSSQNILETTGGGTISGTFGNVTADNNFVASIDYGTTSVKAVVSKKLGSDMVDASILSQNAVGKIVGKSLNDQLINARYSPSKQLSTWVSSGAFNNHMSATSSSAAYSSSAMVTSAGLVGNYDELQIVGGFFNSNAKTKKYTYRASDDIETNGLAFGLGKNYKTTYGEIYLSSQVGAGYSNFDIERNVNVNNSGQTAQASSKGDFHYLNIGAAYKIPTNLKGELSLFASTTFQKTNRDSWSEKGLSDGNVSVSKSSANTRNFEIGTSYKDEISTALKLPQGSFYKLEASGYQSQLSGKKDATVTQGNVNYGVATNYKQNFTIGGSAYLGVPITENTAILAKLERRQNGSFRENFGNLELSCKF